MIGHIGCGYWGKNIVNTLHENSLLSGIYDFDPITQKKFCKKYRLPNFKLDELLSNKNILGCTVATPASSHFEVSKKVLLAGKHLFVEKPICLKLEHAEELKDVAKQKKLRIMVGHLLHFHDGFIEMKKILKTKELGNILKINSYRKSYGILREDEDVIWSFSPHDISMALSVCESSHISNLSLLRKSYFKNNTDAASFQFLCNEVEVAIHVDWTSAKKEQRFEVYCDHGVIIFDDALKDNKLQLFKSDFNSLALKQKNTNDFQVIDFPKFMLPLEREMITFKEAMINDQFQFYNNVDEAISVLRILKELDKL